LLVLLPRLPAAGEEPPRAAPAPREGRVPAEPARGGGRDLPWKPGVEYRYVWIRDGRKAGETRFGLEEHTGASGAYAVLTATRTYDWEGSSQRARSTTTFLAGGRPLAFDETLEVSGLQRLHAQQLTEIRFQDGKAHVKYILNGKEDAPRLLDLDVAADAFLSANQAVEHWAILAPGLRDAGDRRELKLFYPDHAKVLAVVFEKTGEEKLKVGADEVAATRLRFECAEERLKGALWIDGAGRLLQIEFLGAEGKSPELRVVLDKKP
jgi:hypothetical protein